MRVQADHWSVILDFCEKNPQIITNKFSGLGGRNENVELWKTLAIKLNSLGFGEKSVEGWKKTLIYWKSKTKAKAGTINTHVAKTGGGTPCTTILTTFEERLLMLMGKTSYQGNPENVERGFRKRKLFSDHHDITKTPITPVHSYLTDHTYTTQDITAENDILIDYEIPVESEAVSMNPLSSLSETFPKVHSSFSFPSTSSESYAFPHTLTKPFIPLTNNSNQTGIPKVHVQTTQLQDSTPLNACASTPTNSDLTKKRRNKQRQPQNTSENASTQFQNMHKDLLGELKNINSNIASIAESLKELSVSLKK